MNEQRAAGTALLAMALFCGSAGAQSATVDVRHNDPDGILLPGESARVTVHHTRDSGPISGGSYLHHVEGSLLSNPVGAPIAGFASPYLPAPNMWSCNPGSISPGGVTGFEVDFPNHPVFYAPMLPLQWGSPSIDLFSVDFTAPHVTTPTIFTFAWAPAAGHPLIEIYDPGVLQPYAISTTYAPTSILVLPAPPSIGILALATIAATARRRR